MSKEELHFQTLDETVAQLKSGATSSVELTEHMLARINRLQPSLKCYAMVLDDMALTQAQAADEAQQRGDKLGALHGVPVAIKDLVFTKDLVTASGTRVMANFIPSYNATVLTRLIEAGAVIIAKAQLTEGAFGTHHPDIEPPRNPYAESLWPGVSSSGSGVSVAAGLAFAALGSDTGGSIRFPSAACGLVGIKPTYGRVSRYGVFPLAQSLDHIGPMARSVADAARVLGVIAGADPLDQTSLDEPVPNYLQDQAENLAGFNIGIDWRYVSDGVDPSIVALIHQVADQFKTLGAHVQEVEMPPSYRELVREWGITCGVECAQAHHDFYPRYADMYGPGLSRLIDLGLSTPTERYLALEETRRQFTRQLDSLLDTVDVLLAPTLTAPVPRADVMESGGSVEDEDGAEFITFTAPFDYSGHPTITLPAGLDSDGRPLSFQLIGRHLAESTLIQAGSAYENLQGRQPHPAV